MYFIFLRARQKNFFYFIRPTRHVYFFHLFFFSSNGADYFCVPIKMRRFFQFLRLAVWHNLVDTRKKLQAKLQTNAASNGEGGTSFSFISEKSFSLSSCNSVLLTKVFSFLLLAMETKLMKKRKKKSMHRGWLVHSSNCAHAYWEGACKKLRKLFF